MKNLKTFFVISGIILLFAVAKAEDPNLVGNMGAQSGAYTTGMQGDSCPNCFKDTHGSNSGILRGPSWDGYLPGSDEVSTESKQEKTSR